MKVLFVYSNISGFHEDCYSPGLGSILAVTKEAGHDCRIVLIKTKADIPKVLEALAEFKPAVVGFSSVSSQFNTVIEVAGMIKKESPETITVCGGVHSTLNPGCIAQAKSLDAVFVGESEEAFLEFLAHVEKGGPYEGTDNLAFRKDGSFTVNKIKPLVHDIDRFPFPDKTTYPYAETVAETGYAPFFFSRGCPYLCTYCSNHAIAKVYNKKSNAPRFRSAESSIREIEAVIKRFRPDTIFILDDIFGLDKKWRDEFCEKYKKRIGIRFMGMLRANLVDEEFVRILKDAGCYRLSFGVESGNEHIRNKVMKRALTQEQIVRAFRLANKYGFETNALNIIGVPGEDEKALLDTVKLNRLIRPTHSGVNIFYPYRGTQLGDYCFKEGLVDEKLYADFTNERRESVLNYPEEKKKKLVWYQDNWERLVYPYDVKRYLRRFIKGTSVWQGLRVIKRALRRIYSKKQLA